MAWYKIFVKMARKPRLEVEGGLYHLITRGVDRRDIFHSPEDHQKFLTLLAVQKAKLPFFLYAYCLMTNHVHLLIERRADDIGRIMHRVLTGYTQYYNRRYRRSGHVLQGRHKAILCQSDPYLGELVRYIHLNPVRAKMVRKPENYPYSSHRAYIGTEPAGIVDVDPVLRFFAVRKAVARERFAKHVAAGLKLGHLAEMYSTPSGVLGSEEFVDSMIHRIGDFVPKGKSKTAQIEFDPEALITAVENVCGVARQESCGKAKGARVIAAKEVLILSGRRLGASATMLSGLMGLDIANISRRHDAAIRKMTEDPSLSQTISQVIADYHQIAHNKSSISQA
jgi:REP element-mobilizing transposase RayT